MVRGLNPQTPKSLTSWSGVLNPIPQTPKSLTRWSRVLLQCKPSDESTRKDPLVKKQNCHHWQWQHKMSARHPIDTLYLDEVAHQGVEKLVKVYCASPVLVTHLKYVSLAVLSQNLQCICGLGFGV